MGGQPTKEQCKEAGWHKECQCPSPWSRAAIGQATDQTNVKTSTGFHLFEFDGEGSASSFLWGIATGLMLAALIIVIRQQTGWCGRKQAKAVKALNEETARLREAVATQPAPTTAAIAPLQPPTHAQFAQTWAKQPAAAQWTPPEWAWSAPSAPHYPWREQHGHAAHALSDLAYELRRAREDNRDTPWAGARRDNWRASVRARVHDAALAGDRVQEVVNDPGRPHAASASANPNTADQNAPPPPGARRKLLP